MLQNRLSTLGGNYGTGIDRLYGNVSVYGSSDGASVMKYRCDISKVQADNSVCYFAQWLGGPTLAKIKNCRLSLAGDMRRTVTITGEPDTWFSVPAEIKLAGCRIKGYIGYDGNGPIFHPCYYT